MRRISGVLVIPCGRRRLLIRSLRKQLQLFTPCRTRQDLLADHRPLELGKDAHHLEHRPTGRRGGIKALLMQERIDAFGMEIAEEAEQIDERSA
jgi:hypothetical protein